MKKQEQHQTPTKKFLSEYRRYTSKSNDGRIFANHVRLKVYKMDADEVRICLIETPLLRRRRGLATDALKWLCELADAYNLKVGLVAVPQQDCEMSKERLKKWYMKYGFKELNEEEDELVREPCSLVNQS